MKQLPFFLSVFLLGMSAASAQQPLPATRNQSNSTPPVVLPPANSHETAPPPANPHQVKKANKKASHKAGRRRKAYERKEDKADKKRQRAS